MYITETMFIGSLDDDFQLQEIMVLAGDLEVPEPSRSKNATWGKLRGFVQQLLTDTESVKH